MKPIRYITSILVILLAIFVTPETASRDFMAKFLSVKEGLTRNCINVIMRDSRGFLWIGTPYGLNRYDNHKLTQFYAADNGESIYDNEVHGIFEDKNGLIWIFGTKNISRFDPSTEKFKKITCNGNPVKARSHFLQDDGVLLGSSGQLYKYTYSTDSITPVPTKGGQKNHIST